VSTDPRDAQAAVDLDLRLSNEVADALVSIGEVGLLRGEFQRHALVPQRTNIKINWLGEGAIETSSPNTLQVVVSFMLGAFVEEPTEQSVPVIFIRADYFIVYELKPGTQLTKPHLDAFVKLNSVFNLWAYWREYVQSCCARMVLAPIPIPVFRPGAINLSAKMEVVPLADDDKSVLLESRQPPTE
jgi:hypothetical protein